MIRMIRAVLLVPRAALDFWIRNLVLGIPWGMNGTLTRWELLILARLGPNAPEIGDQEEIVMGQMELRYLPL